MKEINSVYILHSIPYEKFTDAIIHFLLNEYEECFHKIMIYGDKNNYVFNFECQQGLGNIQRLICMVKKIYLRRYSILHSHFYDKNITVYTTDDISKVSFHEISKMDYKKSKQNKEKLLDLIAKKSIKNEWDKIIYE